MGREHEVRQPAGTGRRLHLSGWSWSVAASPAWRRPSPLPGAVKKSCCSKQVIDWGDSSSRPTQRLSTRAVALADLPRPRRGRGQRQGRTRAPRRRAGCPRPRSRCRHRGHRSLSLGPYRRTRRHRRTRWPCSRVPHRLDPGSSWATMVVTQWEFDAVLELLATAGHEVVVLVPSPALSARGTDVGLLHRLAQSNTVVLGSSTLVAFADGDAEVRNVLTGTHPPRAGLRLPRAGVHPPGREQFGRCAPPARALGGHSRRGLAPRGVRDAIWEARSAARNVGG